MKDYLRKKFIRFKHWEYWNSGFIYFPVLPYLLYLMVKSKDLFFFVSVNPGIENGGFTLESKWKIQSQMQHKNFPRTAIISKCDSIEKVEDQLSAFRFPVYLKPDIGGKGRGVIQVRSRKAIHWYHKNCPLNYLVQEKIEYANEIGIFYIKTPGKKEGFISGIVAKDYIRLVGNGKQTIEELLRENPRYFLQLDRLKREHPEKLSRILAQGETETISEIGNHAQGSAFKDCSERITPGLTSLMNRLANDLEGFNFGRFDIRFNSWDELERGENFAIIEVNGSGSEPTHIYDSNHSLFFAWSEIIRHWKAMSAISKMESEKKNIKFSVLQGFSLLRNHVKVMRQLDRFSDSIQIIEH